MTPEFRCVLFSFRLSLVHSHQTQLILIKRNGLYNWSFDEKIRNDVTKATGSHDAKGGAAKGEAENGKSVKSEKADAAHVDSKGANGTNGNGAEKGGENGNTNGNGNISGLSEEEREKKERSSIPLQLQRLFARLQLCDVQAVKTKVSWCLCDALKLS